MTVKEQYWKYSLIILIIFMGVILFREFAPFLGGLLGASTIYILVRKQMYTLTEKKKIRKSLAAVLILIEAILCFLIPISFIVWILINELYKANLDPSSYISTIQHVVGLIEGKTGYNVLKSENIMTVVSYLPQVAQILFDGLKSFIINSLAMIFVLYFMLIGGKEMENYFYSLLPFNEPYKKSVLQSINRVVKSNAIGIPLMALVQGVAHTIGFYIFGAPNPLFWGFILCFATIIPLVGTALVWAPLAIYLALTGHLVSAIGLVLYASIFVANMESLVRFQLQKKIAGIHPLITIFGVIIGIHLFGFWGVIFGPLLLSLFILFVDIFKQEYLDKEAIPQEDLNE